MDVDHGCGGWVLIWEIRQEHITERLEDTKPPIRGNMILSTPTDPESGGNVPLSKPTDPESGENAPLS
jgi:hypothetical protein